MKVALVSRVRLNPYVSLMCDGLQQARPGLRCERWGDFSMLRILWSGRGLDILHLHWAELLCQNSTPLVNRYNLALLAAGLAAARQANVRTVYTVHNLHPHELGSDSTPGDEAQRIVIRRADAIHVHSEEVRQEMGRLYGRSENVFVIPHPSYKGYYLDETTRDAARERLGIPRDAFVYVFLGLVRPYKGLSELISSFRELPDPKARLVIAGALHTPKCGETVRSLSDGDARIVTRLTYVPPDEVQFYLRAGDICVLPYRHATTSGAAMLAFTFGCPILAPALGPFPALVGDGERGILFRPDVPGDLLHALKRAQEVDLGRMGAAADEYASALAWPVVAKEHLRVYDMLCGRKPDAGR